MALHVRVRFPSLESVSYPPLDGVRTAAGSLPSSLLISVELPFLGATGLPWTVLESLLALLYAAAARTLVALDHPLTPVSVVLDYLRVLPLCDPPATTVQRIHPTPPPPTPNPAAPPAPHTGNPAPQYRVVALGGTFDHLHPGHKILLTLAAAITTERLVVGVTGPKLLVNKQYAQDVESLQDRISSVLDFLQLVRPGIEHQVVPIEDVYGPTASDGTIEALVVSDETRSGGEAVNAERKRNQLSTLDVLVIDLLDAGDQGGNEGKMGSTAIRAWIAKKRARDKGP